jgi:hypothetical protein
MKFVTNIYVKSQVDVWLLQNTTFQNTPPQPTNEMLRTITE